MSDATAGQPGSEDRPLTAADRDLASIAADSRLDPYLQQLASVTDDGVGLPVTLVTSGAVIVGRLASERAMAEILDELHEQIVAAGERSSRAETWAGVREKIVGAAVRSADERAEKRKQYYDRATAIEDFDVSKVPEELGRATIREFSNAIITIADASVWPSGGQTMLKVKVLRVQVAQIAAWWPANAAVDEPE